MILVSFSAWVSRAKNGFRTTLGIPLKKTPGIKKIFFVKP